MHVSQVISPFCTTPWVFLILVFVLSLPAVTVRFYAADEIEYFAYLRSMWFDGDLSFDNEYRHFITNGAWRRVEGPARAAAAITATDSAKRFSRGGRRQGFGSTSRRSARQSSGRRLSDDRCRSTNRAVARERRGGRRILLAVYRGCDVRLCAVRISRLVAVGVCCAAIIESPAGQLDGRSAAAAFAVWIGTPLLFYMYLAPGFSHAASAFAVAAFVALWLHVRRDWSWRGICALGAMAAIMGMVREQDLFIAIGPAIDYVSALVRAARSRTVRLADDRARRRRHRRCDDLFSPADLTYVALYGRPAPSPTVEGKMTWTSPHAWQVLASPDNGLLFWTPLALAGVGGLRCWLAGRTSRWGFLWSRSW